MLSTTSQTDWLSAYLYYENLSDTFLISKVSPFMQNILKKKYAKHFFFIRYGDKKGPHIRLRFQGNKETLETKVKPLLNETFPKTRFVTYRPELKRYGGDVGIIIAEKLFEASSRVVLSFLETSTELSYEKSLGFALQLNLSMIHALGMKKAEAIAFFDHMSTPHETQEFEAALTKQNATILPFLSQLWAAFDYGAVTENEWFNIWQKEMTAIGAELQKAYKQKKLRYVDPNNAHAQNPLWYIYESYQHMNNNRLGIARIDEQYIAYILKRSLLYEK